MNIYKNFSSFITISILVVYLLPSNHALSAEGDIYLCKMKSHIVITTLGSMARKSNLDFKLQWKGNEINLGQGGIFMNPRMKIKRTDSLESFHAENFNSQKFLARSILSFDKGKLWFTENYGKLSGVTSLHAKCEKIK